MATTRNFRTARINEDQADIVGRLNSDNWSTARAGITPEIMAPGVLVINEIDSDTPGTDAAEFVELYDGGLGNMSLNGYVLVFFNGSNDLSYAAFDLDGFTTDANGYFVIGNAAVPGVDLIFAGNLLQNGQDAVALYLGNATNFPTGTAPTTANLIDAIVYDTADADDAALLAALGETTQYDEGAGGAGGPAEANALARVPNETGGFVAQAPTPNAANVAAGETQTVVFNPTTVTHAEGDSGTTTYTFTVTRTGGTTGQLDFSGTIAAGSTDNADYLGGTAPTTFSGSILAGQTSATVTVSVQGDDTIESDESFTLTITTATNAASGVTTVIGANDDATGNITNDDASGAFSIDDVAVTEGNSGTTAMTFTVTRASGDDGAVSVDYTVNAPGGAGVADSGDFAGGTSFAGTLSFADGETSKTITLDVIGDTSIETSEAFSITLSNALGGASIVDGTGAGLINNDDVAAPAGSVSIADMSIVEGNSGTSILILTLTRSGGTAAFDVNYATSNGGNPNNASATAGSDYVAASGLASFADGQNTATIQITINGDTTPELSEEFTVTLSGATNGATLSDATAIATITTDDPQPASTRVFDEDFTGFTAAGFAPNPTATQIDSDIWRVVGLSDIPNPAYGFTATTGDFARGTIGTNDPTTAGVYSVTSNPALVVQPTGAELEAGGFIEARITNSSGSTATGFDIAFDWAYRNSADRASSLTFSYSLDGTNFVTVPDAAFTTPGTLAAGATFTTSNETLSLTGLSVANGSFIYLRWTHASSAGSGSRDEVGIDNVTVDATGGATGPLVSVGDVSVNEAAGTMTFTITRANAAAGAFTVDFATANGTAIAGSDYVATSGTASFTDNQVSATVTVTINDEAIAELDETLLFNLSNATGATIADGQGVGTIVNDDGAPIQVSINDVSITEGNAGTSLLTFTVTRAGGTGAFDVDFATANNSAVAPGDYFAQNGTLNFGVGQNTQTVSITINGDMTPESSETFFVNLANATNNAVITDGQGVGTIVNDEATFIHDIQGTAYFSPILATDGISAFNTASTTVVTVRAIVTAVDNVGNRQGYYLAEEITDWDGNSYTSEGIFVMTRNDAGVGTVVSGVSVGDLIQVSAQVMEYQAFSTMPRTMLVNSTGLSIISTGNALPTMTLTNMPNAVMTLVTPDYTDSSDGAGDTFDASVYALSYFETVEGMLVTIPNMVVADGFVQTSGGDPYLQAYSLDSANANQINSRGGYTIAGDPPLSPPNTATTGDDTTNGGRVLHDGDVNPDIIEIDFTDFAISAPAGLLENATMGDQLGDVTGIIDFDFTDRKLFVTAMEPGGFVNGGIPVQETTAFGNDDRSLTVATFNVENLDPGDGAARFTALANAIANNLNAPDIICIEEMQDNNGATASGGADASTTWQMLVDALNLATGKVYQWVDQEPVAGAEGGEPGGNIRVGFLYDTGRVQLGNLDANATLAERRQYTDRIGDGVRDAGDLIAFSDNMLGGEINTADWTTTRKSLLGEFVFNGNTVYVTANHWPAKGGSGDFWQFNQNLGAGEPDNSDWAQRTQIGLDVYAMMSLIQAGNANAGIVAGGDFNDFYFYRPLEALTGYVLADGTARAGGPRFDNLTLTLAEAERYTYTFDGRSQAIDHVIANGLLSAVAGYDVVHLNTGYNSNGTGADANPALSDHDPALASFDYRNFSEVLNGTAGSDTIDGFGGNDTINGRGGADTMRGGTGDDSYFVDSRAERVIELSGEGYDIVYADISGFTLETGSEVEVLATIDEAATDEIDLTGNDLSNYVTGNAGANTLDGGTGSDYLWGREGDDSYYADGNDVVLEYAGHGYDIVYARSNFVLGVGSHVEVLGTIDNFATDDIALTGNGFVNYVTGNAGNNTIDGGAGADSLEGRGGADTFAFTTALGGGNIDLILDFASGSDRIALDDAVFTGLGLGPLSANAFVVGTQAGDADDRIIYNSSTGALSFDADGNGAGAAVQFATLQYALPITSSDFIVI